MAAGPTRSDRSPAEPRAGTPVRPGAAQPLRGTLRPNACRSCAEAHPPTAAHRPRKREALFPALPLSCRHVVLPPPGNTARRRPRPGHGRRRAEVAEQPLAAEGQDLDHKLEPHANGTEGGGELAKDIAAFANSTGGVLVLGLQDDRKTSIPVHASPIQLTDGLRRRYSETLASRTAPILEVDIHFAKETHAQRPSTAGLRPGDGAAQPTLPARRTGPHRSPGRLPAIPRTVRFAHPVHESDRGGDGLPRQTEPPRTA